MKNLKIFKTENVWKIFMFSAFIVILSVIVFLSINIGQELSDELCLFIKDIIGCSVLSFVLAVGAIYLPKKRE